MKNVEKSGREYPPSEASCEAGAMRGVSTKPPWPRVKLGEVCEFHRGLTYSKKDEVAISKNVVLRSNNVDLITGKLDLTELKYITEDFFIPQDKRVIPGSLLMCMANGSKAHLGKVAIIDSEINFAFGGFMGLLVPNNNRVLSEYLYWVLSAYEFKQLLANLTDGANINNLKFSDIECFAIPLPPLPIQREIVVRLERELGSVEKVAKKFEELERAAEAEFKAELKECFEALGNGTNGTYGTDETKLARADQRADGAAGDGAAVASVARPMSPSCPMSPSQPPAPCRWVKLGEVCEVLRGGSPRPIKSFLTEDPNGLNWIKIGDVDPSGKYITKTEDKIRREGLSKTRQVKAGDFLLSNSMSFGRPYILKIDGCIHDGWLVLKGFNKVFDENFFYYLLRSEVVQGQFNALAHGSTVRNLNTEAVSIVILPLPPLATQRAIVAQLDAARERRDGLIAAAKKGREAAALWRKAILKEAFE